MQTPYDIVQLYGQSQNWNLAFRAVLVEGKTDEDLFILASNLEQNNTGVDLLTDLSIISAGYKEDGGVHGVNSQLITLRNIAKSSLKPYRFIALYDNDRAGQIAFNDIIKIDTSILPYRDVFKLLPQMPLRGNTDPKTLKQTFSRINMPYKGLSWEIEDCFSDCFFEIFSEEYKYSIINTKTIGDKTHRELTDDGKANFHRFIKSYAQHSDLCGIINVLKSLRFILNLPI